MITICKAYAYCQGHVWTRHIFRISNLCLVPLFVRLRLEMTYCADRATSNLCRLILVSGHGTEIGDIITSYLGFPQRHSPGDRPKISRAVLDPGSSNVEL